MLRLTLASVLANRGRLTMTAIAVTLSVAFVASSFVLADSLRSTFGDVSSTIYADVDAEVRAGEGTFDVAETGDPFPVEQLAGLGSIDGVETVVPSLGASNEVFTVGPDGDVLRQAGPPTLSFSFGDAERSAFTLTAGAIPGPGDVVLDEAQAAELGVSLGDDVTVASPAGTHQFELSGLVTFGEGDAGVTPYFVLVDLPTIQSMLDLEGQVSGATIGFVDDAPADVEAAVEAALPAGLVLLDQETLIAEQDAEFGQIIDVIQIALLVFAAITAFVSAFVIANTFAVLVGQRTRQIGLLRSIGATGRQAAGVVVAEAAVVGLVSSAVGLIGGLGIAQLIEALVAAVTDGGFPEGPTQILPRTIAVCLAVGVGVTVLSALLPARRAASVSPLVALRGSTSSASSTGGATKLLSLALAPLRSFGMAGRLAGETLVREPRRLFTTAMSMIVGLALISAMTVIAASYQTTLEESVASDFDADLIATGADGAVIPFAAFAELELLAEVEAASGFGTTEVLDATGSVVEIATAQASGFGGPSAVLDLGLVGSPIAAADEVLVAADHADAAGVTVGDSVELTFSDGTTVAREVVGEFHDDSVIGAAFIVDAELAGAHARNSSASVGALRFAEGVSDTDGRAAVDAVLAGYPQIGVESVEAHVASRQAQADQLLMLANGLLALTVIVALTGIANTVALSVLQRTNELGLLRAVGMSRRQLRRMVRLEAFATAVVGASVGVGAGTLIAVVASQFLPDTFVAQIEVPVAQLLVFALVGMALGVLAAIGPALRASRLRVLDAIRAT